MNSTTQSHPQTQQNEICYENTKKRPINQISTTESEDTDESSDSVCEGNNNTAPALKKQKVMARNRKTAAESRIKKITKKKQLESMLPQLEESYQQHKSNLGIINAEQAVLKEQLQNMIKLISNSPLLSSVASQFSQIAVITYMTQQQMQNQKPPLQQGSACVTQVKSLASTPTIS